MSVSRRVFRKKEDQYIKLSVNNTDDDTDTDDNDDNDNEVSSVNSEISSDEEIKDSNIKIHTTKPVKFKPKISKKKKLKIKEQDKQKSLSESDDLDESEDEIKNKLTKNDKKTKRNIFRIPKLDKKQQDIINKIVGHNNLLIYYEKNKEGAFDSTIHSVLHQCLKYNKTKRNSIIDKICDKTECFKVNRHIKYLIINKNEKKLLKNI